MLAEAAKGNMAFNRLPKINEIYDALEVDLKLAEQLANEAMGPVETTLQAQSALAFVYCAQGKYEEAVQTAQASIDRATGAGDRFGEATAKNSLARVLCQTPTPDLGRARAVQAEAVAIYQEIGEAGKMGVPDCVRTLVQIILVEKQPDSARSTVKDWIKGYAASPDKYFHGGLSLVLSEACLATLKTAEALAAAKEAAKTFEAIGDLPNQALSLLNVVSADMMSTNGEAVSACETRVRLFKELGDQPKEAAAVSLLAQAHVSQIGLKLATCAIASTADTMGGLKSAKEAYALYTSLGDRDGMDGAMGLFGRVLMYNGVSATVIETMTDPEEIYQDVMSGKYTTPTNAFPPAPQVKQPKVEEIIPTARQLDRAKFTWQQPNAGYSYTLIWQAVKDRNITNKKPRGSYDVLTLNTGTKSGSLAQAFTTMCNEANSRNKSMVVYMTSQDHNTKYATNIITQQSTLACLITSKVNTVSFVQFGEGHFDWTDIRARQVNMYPVTLALMRSCRIEVPTVNIGFVSGDAASWMADPTPLIEDLFNTLESDECEICYRRGEPYGPLIVHRPQEEGVQYVKAKKGLSVFYK